MQASLIVVTHSGTCAFCWRRLPVEHLHEGSDGGSLFCNDTAACEVEFGRWDRGETWGTHPEFERMAVAG